MTKNYQFFVYIIASDSGTLYVGMTTGIAHRVEEHKGGINEGFTKKYGCYKLVYYEEYQYVYDAIARENQLKKWRREKKEALITSSNPGWRNMSLDWVVN